MKRLSFVIVIISLAYLTAVVFAADLKPRKPGPGDKCPVCGMFVSKYFDFAAQIQFKDGTVAFFDGPKDLFTYYQGLSRYNPKEKQSDVAALFVTSYYTLTPIDGISAWYVAGSDVYGPMGRELVPFAKESEAREFSRDHKGKALHRFRAITPAVVKGLN
jgi:nitrous oxide reductase accessory protein NosL